ncbi:MAG: hypothetical protein IKK84_00005 [Clostridia bacterium]|nr:hypothetical protein [Clostridia bacterium]
MGNCEYLNKNYGKGAYICLFELKPIGDDERCKSCIHNTEKEKDHE